MTDRKVAAQKPADLYASLINYFEAYHILTEQAVKSANDGNIDLLVRLMNLRQQTITRIDNLQQQTDGLKPSTFDEETKSVTKPLRKRVRELILACQKLEEGMDEKFAEILAKAKSQASALSKGQRGLRGYAHGTKRDPQYIESHK